MVDGCKNAECFGIIFETLDADGALAGGGEHFLDHGYSDSFRNELFAEAVDGRPRQNERVECVAFKEFAEAGSHVASDFRCLEIWAQEEELVFAAQAGSGDDGALWQSLPAAIVFRGQAVRVVFALKDSSDGKLRREFGWKVFQAVDRCVDFAAKESFFEFLGEKSLLQRARRAQADIEPLVACGLDDLLLDQQLRMRLTQADGRFACLNESKLASSGAENDFFQRDGVGWLRIQCMKSATCVSMSASQRTISA